MKRSDTILSTTTLEMSKSKLQFTYVASSDLLSITFPTCVSVKKIEKNNSNKVIQLFKNEIDNSREI